MPSERWNSALYCDVNKSAHTPSGQVCPTAVLGERFSHLIGSNAAPKCQTEILFVNGCLMLVFICFLMNTKNMEPVGPVKVHSGEALYTVAVTILCVLR